MFQSKVHAKVYFKLELVLLSSSIQNGGAKKAIKNYLIHFKSYNSLELTLSNELDRNQKYYKYQYHLSRPRSGVNTLKRVKLYHRSFKIKISVAETTMTEFGCISNSLKAPQVSSQVIGDKVHIHKLLIDFFQSLSTDFTDGGSYAESKFTTKTK